jgi:glutathione S-transferase
MVSGTQRQAEATGNDQTVPARMRLFSGPLSMFGAKAQIAALEKGLDFELVMVPFGADHRYEPKHPDVLRINPKRQVPVLIHGDLEIVDSTQIFEYLEDLRPQPALWPAGTVARARARLLEHKSDEVYFPHIIRLMVSRIGWMTLQRRPPVMPRPATTARWRRFWPIANSSLDLSRSRTLRSTWRRCSASA